MKKLLLILVASFLVHNTACAAIASVGTGDGGFTNPGGSQTYALSCSGTQPFVVVGAQTQASGGTSLISGITYNGVALTKLYGQTNPSLPADVLWWWYLSNASTGSNNVVVTLTDSSHYIGSIASCYSGGANPVVDSNNVTSNASNATLTNTITSSNANDWFIAFVQSPGTGTHPTASGYTERIASSAIQIYIFDSNGALSAGSNTFTLSPPSGANSNIIEALMASPFVATAIDTIFFAGD